MRMMAWLVALAIWAAVPQEAAFQVGLAEIDITPPVGYRMDGYFYERLNTGQRDPLKAKALVLQQGTTRAALVVCDLHRRAAVAVERGPHAGGGANRHSRRQHRHHRDAFAHRAALRRRAGAALQRTGGGEVRKRSARRGEVPRSAARQAGRGDRRRATRDCRRRPWSSHAAKKTALSFNRRFHLKDGTVRFNPGVLNPEIVRPAGPIDPDLPFMLFHEGQEARRLVDGVRAACRYGRRHRVLSRLSRSPRRRAAARIRRRVHLGLRHSAPAATSTTSTSAARAATTRD